MRTLRGEWRPGREPCDGVGPALDDLVEADLFDVRDTVVEGREHDAVVEIRGVDGVSLGAQRVGERTTAGREAQCVMEQDDAATDGAP